MRFFSTFFAAAAFVCSAIAANTENIPTTDKANPISAPGARGAPAVKAGEPYTIEWLVCAYNIFK